MNSDIYPPPFEARYIFLVYPHAKIFKECFLIMLMEYDILRPWRTLDPWQEEYIAEKKNCFLLCGRQSGKTTAMSIKFGERAANNKDNTTLMIAFTEKQAYNLFFKTLMYLEEKYPRLIRRGKDKPTKHEINLKNGSKIMCYAAGLTGEGIRTYTVNNLVIDEAAPMAREVFIATSPMLSVTGGTMDISSTPRGKEGYFYECSKRKDFRKFYVSAEDCPRHSKEFLEAEKDRMSYLEYAQEYLAQFLDELKRYFDPGSIKECCCLKRRDHDVRGHRYFLGVDIARFGSDKSTFQIIEKFNNHNLEHVDSIITKKTLTTDTEDRILDLDRHYNFEKIYIDAGAGSLGVGVFDHLLRNEQTKRKVIAINNRSRPLDREGKAKIRILKEDLYDNLRSLMEKRQVRLLKDDEVIESLASIQFENIIEKGKPTKTRIFASPHHLSDIAEGLIRAAWCVKDKDLNIWIRSIKI